MQIQTSKTSSRVGNYLALDVLEHGVPSYVDLPLVQTLKDSVSLDGSDLANVGGG